MARYRSPNGPHLLRMVQPIRSLENPGTTVVSIGHLILWPENPGYRTQVWDNETNGTDSSRRLFQKSVRAGRGGKPWTDVRDGPLGWTFETNVTDSSRRLFQKSVRAGRGGRPWTDSRDGPLGMNFETNGTDPWRRLFQKSIRAGRGGGPWTDCLDGLLGWTFETNCTDSSRLWHGICSIIRKTGFTTLKLVLPL